MEAEVLPPNSSTSKGGGPSSTTTSETIITIEPDAPQINPSVTIIEQHKPAPNPTLNEASDKAKDAKPSLNLDTKNAPNPSTLKSSAGTPLLLSPNNGSGSAKASMGGSATSISDRGRAHHQDTQRNSKLTIEKSRSLNASRNALPLLESGAKSSLSRLLSGSGSCLVSSTGTASEEKLDAKMPDGKMVTPRRHPRTNIKGLPLESGGTSSMKFSRNFRQPLVLNSALKAGPKERLCEQHCFQTDVADVRQMEQGLLQLLDDFHSGKLQAFGQDCTVEKMEQVREQQERLARLHFDLNSGQEIVGPQTNEGRQMAKENLPKLIESLHQLSLSIEQLQSTSPGVQTQV